MFSLVASNLQVRRHACNWQSCLVVSFMKHLFLEDELKYFSSNLCMIYVDHWNCILLSNSINHINKIKVIRNTAT